MTKNRTIPKLLKLKDNKKKEIEIDVKNAADRLDAERSRLDELEKKYMDTLECFNEKNFEGCMDVNKLNAYYDFFSRINGRISEQKEIHDQRQGELNVLKHNLMDAHKDKRVMEILNEKEIKKYLKEQLASEQKEADFFAISRRLK